MNFLAALLFSLTSYGITDGDTLHSGQLKVRLWGIDALEGYEKGNSCPSGCHRDIPLPTARLIAKQAKIKFPK